jgi:hypothetical protein
MKAANPGMIREGEKERWGTGRAAMGFMKVLET